MHSESTLCRALCTSFVVSVRKKFQWISVEIVNGFQKQLKCKEREFFKTVMPYIGPKASMIQSCEQRISR